MARLQILLSDDERARAKQIQTENGLSSLGNVFRFLLHGKKVSNPKIRFSHDKRKKITVTLSAVCIEYAEQEIKQGRISSLSRLIDILVLEQIKNTELLNEMREAHEQAKRLKEVIDNGV
jgi:hypothetical protein